MKALALKILEGLGVSVDAVEAHEAEQDGTVSLTMRLPYDGVMRLDGRDHRTARAVRLVLSAAAAAQGKKFEWVAQAND
ncbi:MAG TPA: KH domain-containing protein [bacterium]|jgi:predicted RNA-binding protein YlqC (UPF0109 family)|nr:KH domain-containing protein [bacterium]